MADVVKTIGSGKDYSSINSWYASWLNTGSAFQGDNEIGEVWGHVTETSLTVFNTGNSTSSKVIILTSSSSGRHAGKWDTSKDYVTTPNAFSDYAIVFSLTGDYMRVEYLQFEFANITSGWRVVMWAVDPNAVGLVQIIRRNIFKGAVDQVEDQPVMIALYNDADNSNTLACYRNIIQDHNDSTYPNLARCITVESTYAVKVFQNTILDSGTGIHSELDDADTEIKQNFCGACSGAAYAFTSGHTNIVSSKNISHDSTSPDGSSYQGKNSYTDYFVDYSNDDFHLKSSDTVLKDAGDDLGSPYNVDIDGQSVTGTWDIGADEYIAAGLPSAPICWGYADATETTKRTFTEGWTVGDGVISGSGNSEKITLGSGQTKESEVVQKSGSCRIRHNVYTAGSGVPTVEYKDGNSEANCNADSWHTYSSPFTATGFVKVKLSN